MRVGNSIMHSNLILAMLPPLVLAANLPSSVRPSDWLDGARTILNQQWDPIGLHHMCGLADEYDEFRNLLAVLIRAGASDAMLLAYLEWAEVEWIESGPVDRERNEVVVAAFRALGRPPQPH